MPGNQANETRPIAREEPLETPIAFDPAPLPKDALQIPAAAGFKEKSQPKVPS